MNIEAYNLDSLRKLVRTLQSENQRLKEKLKEAGIPQELLLLCLLQSQIISLMEVLNSAVGL
jgi:hypothetical protein